MHLLKASGYLSNNELAILYFNCVLIWLVHVNQLGRAHLKVFGLLKHRALSLTLQLDCCSVICLVEQCGEKFKAYTDKRIRKKSDYRIGSRYRESYNTIEANDENSVKQGL